MGGVKFCYRSYRPRFSGYGYGTHEFAGAFRRNGLEFTLQHVDGKIPPTREDIVIHSGFPHFFRIEKNRGNIARVMLESDSLPRLWVDILNSMDEVWAASEFNRRTFSKAGVDPKKIFVIPDMINPAFSPAKGTRKKGKRFRFLSVFMDLSLRKGWDLILEEFVFTFSGNRNVEWVIQCSSDAARKLRSLLGKMANLHFPVDNILVMGRRPSMKSLAELYRSADCYVLPTRGEGFGRPFLEAAACGLPVIATGWGGHTDFLTEKNSRLLKYRLVKVPAPEALDCYFLAGQRWAEPSRSDLSAALIEAVGGIRAVGEVDTGMFSEERVISLVKDRLKNFRCGKPRKTKTAPQIITYDAHWKEEMPSPAAFMSRMKKVKGDVAMAGTGRNAAQLTRFLSKNGMNVKFYLDRKSGRFMGKKVYGPEDIPSIPKTGRILISTFPASFPEWRALLAEEGDALPVIFYDREDNR